MMEAPYRRTRNRRPWQRSPHRTKYTSEDSSKQQSAFGSLRFYDFYSTEFGFLLLFSWANLWAWSHNEILKAH